jgi:hypothetical protein
MGHGSCRVSPLRILFLVKGYDIDIFSCSRAAVLSGQCEVDAMVEEALTYIDRKRCYSDEVYEAEEEIENIHWFYLTL